MVLLHLTNDKGLTSPQILEHVCDEKGYNLIVHLIQPLLTYMCHLLPEKKLNQNEFIHVPFHQMNVHITYQGGGRGG